jgi:16S rRNA (cytidine1402-2'-O)-methyltransferase
MSSCYNLVVTTKGKFIIGSMPIGNIKDVTVRMLETIESVDLTICENYSFFKNFLNTLGLNPSSDILEFTGEMANQPGVTDEELMIKDKIISVLESGGSVLYISDEGLPGINDPGPVFFKFIYDNGYEIDALPGPSVSTTAFLHSLAFRSVGSFSFLMLEDSLEHRLPLLSGMLSFQNIICTTHPETFDEPTVLKLIEFVGDRDVVICHSMTSYEQKITKTKLSNALSYIDYENGPATVVILADKEHLDEQ